MSKKSKQQRKSKGNRRSAYVMNQSWEAYQQLVDAHMTLSGYDPVNLVIGNANVQIGHAPTGDLVAAAKLARDYLNDSRGVKPDYSLWSSAKDGKWFKDSFRVVATAPAEEGVGGSFTVYPIATFALDYVPAGTAGVREDEGSRAN